VQTRSLRRRVLGSIVGVTALAVVLFAVPLAYVLAAAYHSAAVTTLQGEAARVAASVPDSLGTDGSTLTLPGVGFVKPIVFPNPMLDRGSLRFTLSQPGPLKVEIFDLTGRVIRTLVDEAEVLPGQFEYALDDLTDRGRRIPPGVYFYLVQSQEKRVTGRFLTLR